MNYRLIIALLSAAFVCGGMAQEKADTVKVIENAEKVVVTRNGNSTTVETIYMKDSTLMGNYRYEVNVTGRQTEAVDSFPDDWGMDLPFMHSSSAGKNTANAGKRSKRVRRYVTGFRHLYWGWRFNYGDKGSVKNCFEIGIRDVVGVAWRRGGSELEIGLGFGMRRLLADDGFVYGKNGDGVFLYPLSDGLVSKMSRLDVWSFQVPVLYNQKIGGCAKFSVGGILHLNTYAKAVTKTRDGDARIKTVGKGLHQNLLTPDIMAAFYLSGVGLYATWSPVELFKKEYGPAVKAWSIGVDFLF